MLFMNRRKFSCFPDFFVSNFKTREEFGFLLKSASRSDCKYHGGKDSSLLVNLCPMIHLWCQLTDTETEFLNGIFSRGFGHKLESSQT
jgi:hypothetical protein